MNIVTIICPDCDMRETAYSTTQNANEMEWVVRTECKTCKEHRSIYIVPMEDTNVLDDSGVPQFLM